uniref:WD repeat, SAM and U-box domain-containing protein 1 n=1 Tax=Fundulus heteroclitus TaxID=8078 RepID=A0A3Q2Q3C2_FUNHE
MASLIQTLRRHTDEVSCCAFSQSLLATGSVDKTLRVYSTADFTELPFSPLSGHGYGVHRCCFSPCGGHLFSCSTDGSIRVWSSETGELLSMLEHPARSPLRVCALAPDSCLLVAGASDGTVALWDLPSKTLRRCAAVSEASVVACSFSPCSRAFVTGCTRGDLKLWDDGVGLLRAQKDVHDLGVACCTFAPQFKVGELQDRCVEFRLASCGQDSLLKIWIVSQPWTMTCLHTLTGQTAPVLSCAFSADGELVTVPLPGCQTHTPFVFFPALSPFRRYVTAVALSPASGLMATGSLDRSVNVWRIGDGCGETGKCGRKLPGHSRLLLADWTEIDVRSWLREEGLDELVEIFRANNIDGPEMNQMSKETVAELGIDGYSYERESIESWIRGKTKTSPMTNLPLQTTLLTPNRSLKMAITRWKSSQ